MRKFFWMILTNIPGVLFFSLILDWALGRIVTNPGNLLNLIIMILILIAGVIVTGYLALRLPYYDEAEYYFPKPWETITSVGSWTLYMILAVFLVAAPILGLLNV